MTELLPAFAGALLLALLLGPLGSFIIWRRMAYFGDTIAHASLLGVALSLITAVPMQLAIFLVALTVSLVLALYTRRQRLEADTLLGILAHGGLALGIVLVAVSGLGEEELEAYLFGDILRLSWDGVGVLAALATVILTVLICRWRPLLIATIDPAIATVEGVSPVKMQLLLTLMIAAVIALTVKLTGVLLITALLIIPAAAARCLARGPVQMALLASMVGMAASVTGLFGALHYAAPAGPCMVVAAAAIFFLCSFFHRRA